MTLFHSKSHDLKCDFKSKVPNSNAYRPCREEVNQARQGDKREWWGAEQTKETMAHPRGMTTVPLGQFFKCQKEGLVIAQGTLLNIL